MKELENFATDIQGSDGLTVAKFFAHWCGPCKMLIPVMERVQSANTDVHFIQIDVDKNRDLIKEVGLNSVPAVMVYKDGKEVGRILGLKLQRDYQELIDNAKLQ